MAKTNFNFQATLKLQSKEFQKGVRDVQRSLQGLKTSFLNFASALGVTVGLGKFISMMKDTAVKLDTAKNVLKNVSTDTVEYTENMEHLRKLSNEYGQDLIVLINNFGQFRAAAKDSGLEIESLRKIYGSLVRAAGAYHMSADRTNDMMVAVTQMFSKGKVAAEELRRQLGNSLPGAFNIMAKAAHLAGVTTSDSTAELEDMMRKGKVLANDVMPAFAALLDEITANASFKSLQGSLNRLRNSWTSFVEKADFAGFFKKLVDNVNGGLQAITKNFNIVKSLLLGAGAGILAGGIWKKGEGYVKQWTEATSKEFDDAIRSINRTEKAYNDFFEKFGGGKDRKMDLRDLQYAHEGKIQGPGVPKIELKDLKKAAEVTEDYNNAQLKLNQLQKDFGLATRLNKQAVKGLNKENLLATKILEDESDRIVNGITKTQIVAGKFAQVLRGIGATFKAAFSSIAFGAIIAGITAIIDIVVRWHKEQKRINNIVEATEKAIDRVTGAESETVIELRKCRDELLKNEKGSLRFQKAIEGVNKIMGKTGDGAFTVESNIKDIVTAVDEWIAKLKKVARAQAIIAKINELTAKNIELENENDMIRSDDNSYHYKGRKGKTDDLLRSKYIIKLANNSTEIQNNTKAIDNLTSKLDEDDLKQLYGGDNNGDGGDDDPKDSKKTNLEKVTELFDEYDKKARELNNQLKAGAITAEEYEKELDKLVDSTYKSVTALGDLGEYLRADNKGIGQKTIDKFKKRLDDLKLAFDDIIDNSHDDQQKELGKQLYDKISDNVQKGFQKRMDQDVKDRKAQDIYSSIRGPKERDTSFDYKKDKADIAGEDYENIKEYLDSLRELRNELVALGQTGTEQFNQLNILIGEAAQQTTNFRDRAKLAEWKKDVEELSKAYKEQMYSSVKDVSQSFERLYNVYKDFAEVFGAEIDPDGNFQKILTIFGALFETFETIYSVVQSINALSEASAALEAAQNNEKMKALETQIGLETALGVTKVTAAEAATAAYLGEAAAAKTLGAALKDAAAAAAVKNAMALPYPANLAALASNLAATAGAYASMKGLQAFAKGGIVGGNSTTGDNNVIRANSGEMILTKAQQGTLFNMLNGKAGNVGGGQVEFKIRGSDLVGTLNNYNQKRRG